MAKVTELEMEPLLDEVNDNEGYDYEETSFGGEPMNSMMFQGHLMM